MSTDTPETDRQPYPQCGEVVSKDFARALERRNSELTARIAELEKDVALKQEAIDVAIQVAHGFQTERDDTRQALAEARKDSSRLDWLQDNKAISRFIVGANVWAVAPQNENSDYAASLRAAIDVAMLPATPLPETEGQI